MTYNTSYKLEKVSNLVEDFIKFVDYIEAKDIILTTKKHFLKRKVLHKLNQKLSEPQDDVTKYNDQPRYLRLHLFFNLALAGELFKKQGNKDNNTVKLVKNSERCKRFRELNVAEKYFFLLQTFWVNTDWSKLQTDYYNYSPIHSVPDVINYISQYNANEKINISPGSRLIQLIHNWDAFLKYFEFFGFWRIIDGESYSKNSYSAKAIIPTFFGLKILNILNTERNIIEWNKHIEKQKKTGNYTDIFPINDNLFGFHDNNDKNNKVSEKRKHDNVKNEEEFILPFKSLFQEGQLTKSLPIKEEEIFSGNVIFEVKLNRKIKRTIKLDGKHTLEDLHMIIQKAFSFDNDHLYAFFMDGKAWSDDYYNSHFDSNGPYADEIKIGELDMYIGRKFLYLFDFGDDWRFQVKVIDKSEDKERLLHPEILNRCGDNPKQYGY